MTHESAILRQPPTEAGTANIGYSRLKPDAIGLWGVVFMSVATAAPITAMAGVVPLSIGFGLGNHTAAGYLIATVVLALFGVGYVAMARCLTTTGAFYGFVSHGLSPIVGLGAGLIAALAYIIFEAAIVGAFSYFGVVAFEVLFGIHVHWLVFAVICLALNAVMSYFDIRLATKILGVLLIAELSILTIGAFATAVHGGGPYNGAIHSIYWQSLNPIAALTSSPGVGLGIFLAFWSWVGFESTAIYGEESRDPKRVIPRATMIVIFGIGTFYMFISLMAVSGIGADTAQHVGQSDNPLDIYFRPMRAYLGDWSITAFIVLMMTGSYACALAFHNCAARYLYSLGRERVIPGLARLGHTHPVRESAHIAGFVQTAIASTLVGLLYLAGKDPYVDLFGLFGILGTMAILTAQGLCCFAVIGYFIRHREKNRNLVTTVVAPFVAGVMFTVILFLLFKNQATAAGPAAGSMILSATPWIVYGLFVAGMVGGWWLRAHRPEAYQRLGRVVLEDVTERR